MSTLDRLVLMIVIVALFLVPVMLLATVEGLPLAHTGAFGEQGCDQCHRSQGGSGQVQVEVGPYIPGQKQSVLITITDPTAIRWGFQLTLFLSRNVRPNLHLYIPGQKQSVLITITDPTAIRWGFQLAARQVSNPQVQAGT